MGQRSTFKELREEIRLLREELMELRRKVEEASSLEGALYRRGLRLHRADPWEGLAFPENLPPPLLEEFYERMKKYSFRLLLRDVIKRKSFKLQELVRFSSSKVVEEYVGFLLKSGILEEDGYSDREPLFHLAVDKVRSFGLTLEWFIARVFQREFKVPALWGIRLEGVETGGDYDVLALVEGHLVYVEVKSSPPKHIEQEEVDAFWKRVQELFPALAIFLVDTELRMKDKIVVMFEDLIRRHFGRRWRGHPITRLVDELFTLDGRIAIANSKPSLVGNLGRCLRWWLSGGKGK